MFIPVASSLCKLRAPKVPGHVSSNYQWYSLGEFVASGGHAGLSGHMCAYILVALLHRSHGATVDLESKGATVTGGVMKAWVHSLISGCSVLLL
jgi:hypothetical protein